MPLTIENEFAEPKKSTSEAKNDRLLSFFFEP